MSVSSFQKEIDCIQKTLRANIENLDAMGMMKILILMQKLMGPMLF